MEIHKTGIVQTITEMVMGTGRSLIQLFVFVQVDKESYDPLGVLQ